MGKRERGKQIIHWIRTYIILKILELIEPSNELLIFVMPTLILFVPMFTCSLNNTDLRSKDEPKVHGEIIDLKIIKVKWTFIYSACKIINVVIPSIARAYIMQRKPHKPTETL